jgi:hypothetical protein
MGISLEILNVEVLVVVVKSDPTSVHVILGEWFG